MASPIVTGDRARQGEPSRISLGSQGQRCLTLARALSLSPPQPLSTALACVLDPSGDPDQPQKRPLWACPGYNLVTLDGPETGVAAISRGKFQACPLWGLGLALGASWAWEDKAGPHAEHEDTPRGPAPQTHTPLHSETLYLRSQPLPPQACHGCSGQVPVSGWLRPGGGGWSSPERPERSPQSQQITRAGLGVGLGHSGLSEFCSTFIPPAQLLAHSGRVAWTGCESCVSVLMALQVWWEAPGSLPEETPQPGRVAGTAEAMGGGGGGDVFLSFRF